MSVKNQEWVQRYTAAVCGIQSHAESICAMCSVLPAPDDDGNLPTLHYGHVGSVIEIARQLRDLTEAMRQVVTTR